MHIRIRRLFAVLFIILVSALLWLYSDWRWFSLTPLTPPEQPFYYIVYPGMNITALAHDLYERDLLKKPRYFTTLAKFSGLGTQLKAGEYHLREGMRPRDFLQKIANGDVVMHRLVLLEGWNFKQVMAALQANPKIKQKLQGLSAEEIMRVISGDAKHPEGLLFPDTYQFTLGLSDIAILRHAYETMHTKLENIWQNRDDGLPYQTAYEALIVASIIEKETALEQERPLVASVIVNRLRKRMRLQVDPTVIYGLGEELTGALKHSHL
ncbi:MAG: endolytic transglycosylase MltG, partial [Gammaproteobacteria bacterium]